ncbi:MAG TPA: MarR family transcriptional regulator [Kofleriaceae bacterium]
MDGKQFIETFVETKRLVHLVLSRAMAELEVGLAQVSLLRELAKRGPTPQGALARTKQIDPSAAARMFAVMTKRGWIRRRPSADDRREKCVELTASGRRFVIRVETTYARAADQLAARLDAKDTRALERIRAKITPLAEEPACVDPPTVKSASLKRRR